MHSYKDLLTEIDVLTEQIRLTEEDLGNWSFDGRYGKKFGANTSLVQTQKKLASLELLQTRLNTLEEAKQRLEVMFGQFDGLDYKIAYLRIVEGMTHHEISDELGYTEQYIRRRWMNLKSNKVATETVVNA